MDLDSNTDRDRIVVNDARDVYEGDVCFLIFV